MTPARAQRAFITKGLPGSGKSTWAIEQCNNNGNLRRINDDLLRKDLDAVEYTPKNVKLWDKERTHRIKDFLTRGFDIVVDNTHLNPKTMNRVKELIHQNFPEVIVEVVNFTDVSVEECIKRDAKRKPGEKVGADVIIGMWSKYLKPPLVAPNYKLPDAIICDLDGTLAVLNGRNPFDASKCDETDTYNLAVLDILKRFEDDGVTILFTSGRSDKDRAQTGNFILKSHLFDYQLFMRKEGDMRPDYIVKAELYNEHILGKYRVLFCIDDRPQVVRGWKNLGLPVFNVGDGYEF